MLSPIVTVFDSTVTVAPCTIRLPPMVISPANALEIRASARASVKYKFVEPSARSSVSFPLKLTVLFIPSTSSVESSESFNDCSAAAAIAGAVFLPTGSNKQTKYKSGCPNLYLSSSLNAKMLLKTVLTPVSSQTSRAAA